MSCRSAPCYFAPLSRSVPLGTGEAFVREISAAALAALALVTRMPYETTYCGRLWTLRRNGEIARAEVIQFEGAGLELRYTHNDKPFVRRMFTDGADLLRAAAERFELERDGLSPSPRANGAHATHPNVTVPSGRLTGTAACDWAQSAG